MPMRPKRLLPLGSQTPVSREAQRRLYDNSPERKADKVFYASTAWRKLRAAFLSANPLCVECKKAGLIVAATVADHVKNRKQHPELALEWSNLQALCLPHNSEKAVREEGGFGNRKATT